MYSGRVFGPPPARLIFDCLDARAMKAIVYKEFGLPSVRKLVDIEKPEPSAEKVLVKVHAASVTYSDWSDMRGKPLLVRLIDAGLFKPKHPIPGDDIAGQVEAGGQSVDQLQPGDQVVDDISGFARGGFPNIRLHLLHLMTAIMDLAGLLCQQGTASTSAIPVADQDFLPTCNCIQIVTWVW